MAKSIRWAGNLHLRGKKTMLLSCRCCVARDLRPAIEAQEVRRALREGWDD